MRSALQWWAAGATFLGGHARTDAQGVFTLAQVVEKLCPCSRPSVQCGPARLYPGRAFRGPRSRGPQRTMDREPGEPALQMRVVTVRRPTIRIPGRAHLGERSCGLCQWASGSFSAGRTAAFQPMKRLACPSCSPIRAAARPRKLSPADVLDRAKFKHVLVDAQLIEARMNHEMVDRPPHRYPSEQYYTEICSRRKALRRNSSSTPSRFYTEQPADMKVIYEEVIVELDRRKDDQRSISTVTQLTNATFYTASSALRNRCPKRASAFDAVARLVMALCTVCRVMKGLNRRRACAGAPRASRAPSIHGAMVNVVVRASEGVGEEREQILVGDVLPHQQVALAGSAFLHQRHHAGRHIARIHHGVGARRIETCALAHTFHHGHGTAPWHARDRSRCKGSRSRRPTFGDAALHFHLRLVLAGRIWQTCACRAAIRVPRSPSDPGDAWPIVAVVLTWHKRFDTSSPAQRSPRWPFR